MKLLCNILDAVINPAIICTAILEFVLMCVSLVIMLRFKRRIWKLNRKGIRKSIEAQKRGKGIVQKTIEIESSHDWEEFDQFLEDYQRQGCWYSAFSMIIQIFTLLGILGTVAGLYIAVSNRDPGAVNDLSEMYRGVKMALSTTILGILFAVIYKMADILIVSVFINYIEDGINRYEKIYAVDSEEADKQSGNESKDSKESGK